VVLAVAAPLVFAPRLKFRVSIAAVIERAPVPLENLFGDDLDTDAADAGRSPGEVLVDEGALQTDRLKDLRAAIARDRRDAHLGHHLEDAFVEGLDVVLDGLVV